MTDIVRKDLDRRVAGVQQHYQDFDPHPAGTDTSVGWIKALPITQAILGWVGTGNRVLDLGCHAGDISALIRELGNTVVGVDLPDLAAEARNKHGIEAIGHNLNEPFPFADAAFDVVVTASVLDDIPDDLAYLRECCRVLKTGGSIIVVVPNEASWFRRIQLLLGGMSRDFTLPTGYHTLHWYTLKGIRTLLGVAGFTVAAHRKCPKRFSNFPLRYWIEKALPTTFATDLAVQATKR